MMRVKWNKKSNPSYILERIEKAKSVGGDGNVSFRGLGFHGDEVALTHVLEFDPDFPEAEKERIIWKALLNVGSKSIIESNTLLREINKLQRNFFKRKTKKYTLASSLSLDYEAALSRRRFNGSVSSPSSRQF